MASAARGIARPDAAREIIDTCMAKFSPTSVGDSAATTEGPST
jgi:hypothetical protein